MTQKIYISEYPQLLSEWHWCENDKIGITPQTVLCGSNKKVWWKCQKCGYEWQASPNNRSKDKPTGCPLCANKVVVKGLNDLETLFPQIAKKWNFGLNSLTPSEVRPHSQKKVWWVCEKDSKHIFYARIDHVVCGKIICSVCANQQIIVGVNDLPTTNPELMAEWDYEKNAGIRPEQITRGVNWKVWWKCKNGHRWQATVASRTGSQHCGCPICSQPRRFSKPEKTIAYYLSQHFEIEENKRLSECNGAELDIFISQLNLGIEYDGCQWHKNIERDLRKDKYCAIHNIKLIRIREPGCPSYDSGAYFIKLHAMPTKQNLDDIIHLVIDKINSLFNLKLLSDINIERDYLNILSNVKKIKLTHSVANHPIITEWDYKKNGDINPENISLGSSEKFWWKCKFGHSWEAVVSSRTGKQQCGCPYCANQRVWEGFNDLGTRYPEIAAEWDYTRNNVSPGQVVCSTNKKYWWICCSCGNAWSSSVSKRVQRRGCPVCGRKTVIASHYKNVRNIDTGEIFENAILAGEKYHISADSIRNNCCQRSKSAGGFHWEYVK